MLKKGIDVLGCLRKDAVCFCLPTSRKKEGRGRPRIYGQRLNLEEMVSDKTLFQPYKLFLYGKEVMTEIASQIIILKGWNRPILLVIAKEKNRQPIFLFTTDLSLTPARVVELYAPRWKIEISFRELKQVKMGIPYEKSKVISAFNELIDGQYRDLGNYTSEKLELKLVQNC